MMVFFGGRCFRCLAFLFLSAILFVAAFALYSWAIDQQDQLAHFEEPSLAMRWLALGALVLSVSFAVLSGRSAVSAFRIFRKT